MFKKVIKDTSALGAGTLICRMLGLIRLVLIAKFFGTSPILEAFIVSFRLPNLLRSVFGEGFGDSVAVPVLSEYQKDKKRLFEIGNHLLSLFIVVLFIFSLLGSLFSKYLVSFLAPGFITQPYKFNLAISFTRITFFYLFFIALAVNCTSLLYSLKKFFLPAINPIFLNLSFILGIIFFAQYFKTYILVICVIAGGILQVIFPLLALKREGFVFSFHFFKALGDKTIIRMGKLFLPRLWASLTYHLSVIIDTIFSSLTLIVGKGALAAITYANILIQFPLSFVVLSISRVAVVDLSFYHRQGNIDEFKKLFVFSFQNIIYIIVPISFIFMFIPEAIIDVLLRRGRFDLYSFKITSLVFLSYSFGLFFFCTIKFLVTSFYSLKDTITPAKTAMISLLLNAFLSALLMFPLKIGGVAWGSSLAGIFNCFLLYRGLLKKIGKIDWQDTKSQTLKVIFLGLGMGIFSHLLWEFLHFSRYAKIIIIFLGDLVIFMGGSFLLRLRQTEYLRQVILKVRKRKKWFFRRDV